MAVEQAEQLVQPLAGQGRHRLHVVVAGGLGEQCVPGSGVEQVDLVQDLDHPVVLALIDAQIAQHSIDVGLLGLRYRDGRYPAHAG